MSPLLNNKAFKHFHIVQYFSAGCRADVFSHLYQTFIEYTESAYKQSNRTSASVVGERLNRKDFVFILKFVRLKTMTVFRDTTPTDELKPLTMKELSVAKVYDFDFMYGQKTALNFKDDLAAIDRSMMQKPQRNRKRFKKRRKYPKFIFKPTLEVIEENELFESKLDVVKYTLDKDLAAIHEERALRCATPISEDGRRYRYKATRRTKNPRKEKRTKTLVR